MVCRSPAPGPSFRRSQSGVLQPAAVDEVDRPVGQVAPGQDRYAVDGEPQLVPDHLHLLQRLPNPGCLAGYHQRRHSKRGEDREIEIGLNSERHHEHEVQREQRQDGDEERPELAGADRHQNDDDQIKKCTDGEMGMHPEADEGQQSDGPDTHHAGHRRPPKPGHAGLLDH
jgi:hypothetical protein